MLSRERVVRAISHKETDRIPLDLGGSIATSINVMAYQNLKEYFGFKDTRSYVTNIVLFVPEVEKEIREKLHIDMIPLDRYEAAPGIPLSGKWIEHPLPDGRPAHFPWGFAPVIKKDGTWELFHNGVKIGKLSPGTGSFAPTYFPLKNADFEKLEEFELPQMSDAELEYLSKRAKRLYEDTDLAIFGWFGGSIFEQTHYLCGFDEIMTRFITDLSFVKKLIEKITRWIVKDLELYLNAVGRYIQVIGFYDDLGIQNGPMISPLIFRNIIKPHLAEIYRVVHNTTDLPVFLHSCGSVYEFIEDFIEIGVDILNPVQTSAHYMEPEVLKKEFGDRIVFWGGGSDAQGILAFGTPEDVRKDVERRIEIFGAGGGYIFSPIHNIQVDVPPENVVSMYETAFKCSQ